MLSDYTLDTENFQEIMEEAKNMVASLYPEWTDFNYHDPGITMLEMFSQIKEGQQYFLDQIGLEHKKKYLKLLGETVQKRKEAQAFVKISTEDNLLIAEGTKLSAGEICFETEGMQSILYNTIKFCFCGSEQIEKEEIEEYKKESLHLHIFGENPLEGDCFYIGFEKGLPIEETIGFYVELNESVRQNRNKITNEFFPMLEFSYEFFSGDKWREISNVRDTTYGMLNDGMLFVCLESPMDKMSVCGKEAYYIRLRVTKSDIDIPPVLENIHFNMIPVVQRDTWIKAEEISLEESNSRNFVKGYTYLAINGMNDLYYKIEDIYYSIPAHEKYIDVQKGEVKFLFDKIPKEAAQDILLVSYSNHPMNKRCIGIGNGFPYQEFDLPSQDVIEEEVEILVHEVGSGSGYSRWNRVEDFGASRSEDRHYRIDAQKGKLIFGDCERGMAPEGEIIIISFAETLGEDGNVKKGKINKFININNQSVEVYNPKDAYGGKNKESIEECFFRARKGLKYPETAVTYKDYERYVMETPGLRMKSCKVILADQMQTIQRKNEENTLFIVVEPRDQRELSQNYKKNILAYLENYRLLGTKIEIISPHYIPLEVCLDIVTKPHFLDAKARIEKVALEYFQKISESFGAVIVYSELYGIIEMLNCVSSVNEITIDVRDRKVTRMQDGNILLPPNGVVELKDIQYFISLED